MNACGAPFSEAMSLGLIEARSMRVITSAVSRFSEAMSLGLIEASRCLRISAIVDAGFGVIADGISA